MKRVFCFSFLFVFLAGCSLRAPERAQLPTDITIIRDIPFYADTGSKCGPSSLAAVMNYWHAKAGSPVRTSPDRISAEIFSRGAQGVLGADLEVYARKNSFLAKQYSGGIDDLKQNIINGTPLIILVDYGVFLYQKNHFMVVAGYGAKEVIVHSGNEEIKLPFDELEKIWRKTGYWTLVIRPSA